jgi:hypothetical protein
LNWLTSNYSGGSLSDFVSSLKIGVFDAVITTGTQVYLQGIQAVAGDAGFGILFASSTPGGTSGFSTYIHELAHLLNAPGFNQADGSFNADGSPDAAATAAQAANQDLIQQNCGSTIKRLM